MFVYSLSGLELADAQAVPVEIEENEVTARSACYQVFGLLLVRPDVENHEKARDGRWAKDLAAAAELLAFDFEASGGSGGLEVSEMTISDDLSLDAYQQIHDDLFSQSDSPAALAGSYSDDSGRAITEVIRFFEYYGLGVNTDSGLAVDHVVTECEFMQYLTFKEAAAPSPRLARSYRRAQLDFYDRQFGTWISKLAARVAASDPLPFYTWATDRLACFAVADAAYVREQLGV